MRPTGSPDLLSERRRRALKLLDEGLSLYAVAKQIGCAPISVARWRDARKALGKEVFRVKTPPGRPMRLTQRDMKKLEKLLLKGPLFHGYSTDLWTTQRIADLIGKHFGVRYHRDHVGRILLRLGWTHQKPERRAMERDEERIERFKREEWPRIKKSRPVGCPHRLYRRVGFPLDTLCAQNMGAERQDPRHSPPLPARSYFRHLRAFGQPEKEAVGVLLPTP